MQELVYLFIIFIIYSIIGWLIEICLSILEHKKFINRGFLFGPYCPIYGVGCLCLIYVLKKYNDDLLALFTIGTFLCSVLEYFTSYLLEKIFKARWWDYSHIPFNVNGRICLSNSLLFGIAGIFVYKFNPFLLEKLQSIPVTIFYIIAILILIIFIIDVIISFNIVNKLKLAALNSKSDNTEEIKGKISNLLKTNSNKFRRLLQAFPDATISNIKKLKKK